MMISQKAHRGPSVRYCNVRYDRSMDFASIVDWGPRLRGCAAHPSRFQCQGLCPISAAMQIGCNGESGSFPHVRRPVGKTALETVDC